MQALEHAAAVFCTACICAELAARFVGPGWGQKCIKAVAGLYILVAFADALPGAKAQLTAPKLPQAETTSVGSLEDAILAQTEEELSLSPRGRHPGETAHHPMPDHGGRGGIRRAGRPAGCPHRCPEAGGGETADSTASA